MAELAETRELVPGHHPSSKDRNVLLGVGQNPQWFGNPEVSRILRDEGHGREGVAEVNEYLEESYADSSAANAERRKWRLLRQNVVGGVVGLYLGGTLGDYFTGDVYPWDMVGLVLGILLVALFQRFPAA